MPTIALTTDVVLIQIAFGWKSNLSSEPSIYAENVPKPLTLEWFNEVVI